MLIFSLNTKSNKIPCFKLMKKKLKESFKKDKILLKIVKKYLKKTTEDKFSFKVKITKLKYISMINSRYISCLLNISDKELKKGIGEIQSKYKNQIEFTDTLKCISFRK